MSNAIKIFYQVNINQIFKLKYINECNNLFNPQISIRINSN